MFKSQKYLSYTLLIHVYNELIHNLLAQFLSNGAGTETFLLTFKICSLTHVDHRQFRKALYAHVFVVQSQLKDLETVSRHF